MRLRETLKIALPFAWFGAVCAISFMEAPLKFGAPNLTTPVALEVGHIVFDALNKVEWGICVVLGISLFTSGPSRIEISAFVLVMIVLLSQTFWLFPILDERTLAIIDSRPVPESNLHLVYIVLEVIKVILLPVLGTIGLRNMSAAGRITRQDSEVKS